MHTAEDVLKVMQSLMKLESIAIDQLSLFATKSSAEYDESHKIEIDEKISEIVKIGGITKENPLLLVIAGGNSFAPSSSDFLFRNLKDLPDDG